MREINLSRDLLNSNKIIYHYGAMMEQIRKGKTDFSPIAIEIHPTAMCNHRCTHCSYKERNENRATMPREMMNNLIQSIINMGVRAVYFSGGGEPTLFPGLRDDIIRLTDNNIECAILTNGSCFEDMGLIPIANRLNYIAVSVPAVNAQDFKAITGTNNLEKVLNLPQSIKKVHGIKSPILGSRIIITNKNYMRIKDFLYTVRDCQFDYALFKVVRDYEDNGQGLGKEEEEFLKKEILECKDIDDKFTNIKSIFNYRKPIKFVNRCWINQYGLLANVTPEGDVYPNIVEIGQKDFCIGNLNESTLEEMWHSKTHNRIKKYSNEKWLSGKCKNCRAMSYNNIINQLEERMPLYYDPFI